MQKLILIVFVIVILGLLGGCGSDPDVGATIDWGDGYYWDSGDNMVKEFLW